MATDGDPTDASDEAQHFPEHCLGMNLFTLSVKADVERTAGALASLLGPGHVWERSAAGQQVRLQPRSYIVYCLAGQTWTTVLAWHDDWDQQGDAKKLSKSLKTKVIAYGGSDVSDSFGYDLYRTGRRIERWLHDDNYDPDDELFDEMDPPGFTSTFRDESWADDIWDPWSYLNSFYRDQGAHEAGYRFGDFSGARDWQLAVGVPLTLPEVEGAEFERLDWVAAPAPR